MQEIIIAKMEHLLYDVCISALSSSQKKLHIYKSNTMQNIQWGMIGCGNVTEKKSGAPAINKVENSALVAVMAIFLFPVLLPITEANPLFRLVGLLPIYHVLAISLLSVEQMSNGMLYAIWAIPAALLFLGVGAGISRRVFAKHQVS